MDPPARVGDQNRVYLVRFGPAISAGKCPKVPKGPQRRLLDDVFRIVLVPHQPARQPVRGIQMGQDDIVKSCPPRAAAVAD